MKADKPIGPGNFPVLHNCQMWDGIENDICPCLRARAGTGGNNLPMFMDNKKEGIMGRYVVRRITPRECERLQGFPDDYTDIPYGKDKGHAPDAHRYKALGNSMAVPVMKWIGERIDWAMENPITKAEEHLVDWQPDLFG